MFAEEHFPLELEASGIGEDRPVTDKRRVPPRSVVSARTLAIMRRPILIICLDAEGGVAVESCIWAVIVGPGSLVGSTDRTLNYSLINRDMDGSVGMRDTIWHLHDRPSCRLLWFVKFCAHSVPTRA